MTRVFGQLFEDSRDGLLVVRPSKPFFGCERHENQYPVKEGFIDIDLLPTPHGVEYLVGFKKPGDYRRVDYTLRWRVQNVAEIDVSPAKKESLKPEQRNNRSDLVQIKRLASELAASMEQVAALEAQLSSAHKKLADVSTKFEAYKAASEQSLVDRDTTITELQSDKEPQVYTIVKEVPVPPERLEARIKFLESELQRTQELNSQYYLSVLELHQLKLDKAQSLSSSAPVISPEDTPRQRLINKLLAQ